MEVRYAEPFTLDELRAGLDTITPIDATEWERRRRALSIDTHVNRVDPDAEDVIVELDPIDGSPIAVTFHVPGDYPLGDDDCRRACFSSQAADATFPRDCNTHPTPVRHDGSILVAALVAPIVETVWIDAGRSVIVDDDERREASTVATPGMADRFFVVQVPTDWCHWVVTSPDADFGSGLSEGGFITSDSRYAGCERDLEPVEYEPPDVCHEVTRDWVASTTSLTPTECIDVPAMASTSTTVPADDE